MTHTCIRVGEGFVLIQSYNIRALLDFMPVIPDLCRVSQAHIQLQIGHSELFQFQLTSCDVQAAMLRAN